MTIAVPTILRIGIDCGGTNTDAVVLDLSPGASQVVLASTKTPTTPEVTHGIRTATSTVISAIPPGLKAKIQSINIGTTHFVNALIQRSEDRLERVAIIRLCGPFSRRTPPFAGFPYELREIVEGPHYFAEGGLQIDGSEISKVSQVQTLPWPNKQLKYRLTRRR
jgi:N-methylhydantoinase A/oxoprolinase/acetone carboxylase beta subunit